jgi:hypothetical protein
MSHCHPQMVVQVLVVLILLSLAVKVTINPFFQNTNKETISHADL